MKNIIKFGVLVLMIAGCDSSAGGGRTVTDIDGNVYKTVTIGYQEWLAENLRVTHYRNGDMIPNVTGGSEWKGLSTGAYGIYINDTSYVADYGYLYNWYAVGDTRNIAPEGWHVATDDDWEEMKSFLGERSEKILKEAGTEHWKSERGATNESGFTILPAGARFSNGSDEGIGLLAFFWSSTENDSETSWGQEMELARDLRRFKTGAPKEFGLSVRLVRDREGGKRFPVARFTFESNEVKLNTIVTFDASSSLGDRLGYRWDFEGDGSFDTRYTTSSSESHKYTEPGTYQVTLEIIDGDKVVLATEKKLVVKPPTGTVTDREGNLYNTVKIGNQWWMAENLKVRSYRNGDAIPNVTGNSEWKILTGGGYCVYLNVEGNKADYGYLYNWFAAADPRNIAPEGWHVATDADWRELEMHLGMDEVVTSDFGERGADEGNYLKATGTRYWNQPNEGANNNYGFSALPGGTRQGDISRFIGIHTGAYFWTTTESHAEGAWSRDLGYRDIAISRFSMQKKAGNSIRCVKDK